VLRKLRHPNIVLYMGYCSHPSNFCIITEFLANGSLWDILHNSKIQFTWSRIIKMACDTSMGMSYLHLSKPFPIIHRDLKSANLLVDESFKIKIADFGLSKTKALAQHMTSQTGTPAYMAPEVITTTDYSEKIDVYGFGIIMWELITRKAPYENLTPMQILYGVVHQNLRPLIPSLCPPVIYSLINMCWHQLPEKRPSFNEILSCLKSFEASSKLS